MARSGLFLPHSGTKSSSKRNESCIAFSGSIPEQLLHSGIDLLKIRPIVRWYNPVEAHQRCIYTANCEAIQNSYAICLIFISLFCPMPAHGSFRKISASYRNRSSSKRNKSCIGFIVLIPEQLRHSRIIALFQKRFNTKFEAI